MAAVGAATLPGLMGFAALPGQAGPIAAKVAGPQMKLIPAQNKITVSRFGRRVFLDPGIWLAAMGSPLELDVSRASYAKPMTITQVIHTKSSHTVRRAWPASVLDGWHGLKNFATMTVKNSAGKVVATSRTRLCLDSFDTQRVTPDSPATSPYPEDCGSNPFTLGQVWGVQKDWAVNPFDFGRSFKLALGTYHVTVSVNPTYVKLLHISASAAHATITAKVVKGNSGAAAVRQSPRAGHTPAKPPAVPAMASPPKDTLPDMIPLPSHGIRTSHTRSGLDLLDFGATVWMGGNGPLDVEGFRSAGSPVMKAYQYFWRDGKVIGRTRAGTMGFDTQKGHNHWHFQQFAKYQLLNKNKSLTVSSHKVGFCIAPTDAIDLVLKNATWNPPFLGFGDCGSQTSLWVGEQMPLGWGDTYTQSVAGQAFNITHVRNGTYFIAVTANPERVIHETNTRNDVSFRKVILGGRRGHRTVKVPAVHGIDPEH